MLSTSPAFGGPHPASDVDEMRDVPGGSGDRRRQERDQREEEERADQTLFAGFPVRRTTAGGSVIGA